MNGMNCSEESVRNIPFSTLKPLYEQHAAEYNEAALRALRSGWYIMGKEVEAFENEFASYIGASHCIGLNSGLDALVLALRALGIGKGDEVVVQANTYIATVLAITENGATPVFVEPDEFHGIDPIAVEKVITNRTKAIMVVHLYGQPCDMDALGEISRRTGVPIVEDCAQSHGSTLKGKMTGTFGRIACFSFYPTKNLGAFGDAGAAVTDDPDLADKLRILRNYGSKIKYQNEIEGINSRLDEIQAALLRVRLKHLNEILEERRSIAEYYLNGIRSPRIRLPRIRSEGLHTWHQFVVECDSRDELQEYLKKQGIQTQIHYPIPPHLSEAYKHLGLRKGDFPLTERLAESVLSLPLYNGMARVDTERVVEALNVFPTGRKN
ncbi:dTDP-3-amino-3,6-dideoxy-alpha-D-galactopyranose transaminase [bioreactor metagenome]|uniref:dTDP-3-amino-3,6-dideoxy-alpha-D-galactopyranose transaminase n=1 Tax=bioreactor metagenome TaxID=1076179 RepID=A0A644XVC7_9ZZZZ